MSVTSAARAPRTGGLESLLADARSTLVRLSPRLAARAQRDGALLVDIRPHEQRRREGDLPGAVIVERNVLEWRLEPGSPWQIAELAGRRQIVVVVCSDGYASSLAAASLQRVGLVNATDMIGGFLAWRRAGLPVVAPDGRRPPATGLQGPVVRAHADDEASTTETPPA